MTVASLNYTGRVRINQEHIQLELEDGPQGFQVQGKLDLAPYGFKDAKVIIELYRQSYRVRSACGDVQDTVTVAANFKRYAQASALLCDIKVVSVDPAKAGQVIGWAKQIRPELSGNSSGMRQGLLPFTPKDDMGDVLWATDTSGDDPAVLINAHIDNWKSFCRGPIFQSLVMPEIVRDLSQWLWDAFDRYPAGDNEVINRWVAAFKAFGADIEEYKDSNPEDNAITWAIHAVNEFSAKFKFLKRFNDAGVNEE